MSRIEGHAKEPVSAALAGPYGHPFHPMLVTVPIGAWVSSLVFDVAARFVDDRAPFDDGARWLIAIGVVGALAAAAVGFLDFFSIPKGTPAHRVAVVHLTLNLTVTGAFAGDFAWRSSAGSPTPAGPFVLTVVALVGLAVSGWLGGKLAYRYGVRVASESVQAEGYAAAGANPDSTTHEWTGPWQSRH